MPKHFKFYVDNALTFQCELESERCTGQSKNGNQCRRNTVIGLSLCWQHLLSQKELRIKDSRFGKGLFALNKRKDNNAIIFKKNQTIISYNGEVITENDVYERYQENTAPYTIVGQRNTYEDGACHRGIGTLVNHATGNAINAKFSYNRQGVIIKATKNIRNGQEIFVNYNAGHTRNDQRYLFDENTRHTTK